MFDDEPPTRIAAIVLAGGESRRFGSDKLAAPYGHTTVLGHLMDGLRPNWQLICVGPPRPLVRLVRWTREEPPGGGPVAGITAGLTQVLPTVEVVVVLAGDQPNAAPAAERLVDAWADSGADVAVAIDAEGRMNPLLAAFGIDALRRNVPADPVGRAARSLLDGLQFITVPIPEGEHADVDVPGDLP